MSFGGKYLACESCLAIPQKNRSAHAIDSESTNSCDHEMFKIYIPGTDLNLFGPAFIEVSILWNTKEIIQNSLVVHKWRANPCLNY